MECNRWVTGIAKRTGSSSIVDPGYAYHRHRSGDHTNEDAARSCSTASQGQPAFHRLFFFLSPGGPFLISTGVGVLKTSLRNFSVWTNSPDLGVIRRQSAVTTMAGGLSRP